MVLCGADPATARALRVGGVTSAVPLVRDAACARRALERRPVRVHRSAGMPAAPASLAWARSTVRHACEDWDLGPAVCEAALLVATELVTNAVVHAGTPSVLGVGLDAGGLHITVRDQAPGPVAFVPRPGMHGGYGLRVVAELSRSWGVIDQGGGKTVWAVLALDGDHRPPPTAPGPR
jgi:anti-sigma regulatory factor (Ser/Thr protein kinase)